MNMDSVEEVVFSIHDEICRIQKSSDIGPETTLNQYLRNTRGLTGTKTMCEEGGCGACVVAVTVKNPITKKNRVYAVNSCLIPVLACHSWDIKTTEGIGDRKIGYHPIQQTLTKFNGTQCGYCTGGMIMNMYSLYESNKNLTMEEIENSFGGNMCRCTGYRPIMDAFKSLAANASKELVDKYPDIEDIKICSKTEKPCLGHCDLESLENKPVFLDLNKSRWYKLYTIDNILQFFQLVGESSYTLVGGSTGKGVFKSSAIMEFYADITAVPELITANLNTDLIFGANMSLTDAMSTMLKFYKENPDFWYLNKVYSHFDLIANVPVRNAGTLAGNLSLKHDHHEFPSDIFTLFEACKAQVTIVTKTGSSRTMPLLEYLDFNMHKCFMKNISLPPLNKSQYIFESYKITPRLQNAHAYVNAAFLIEHENYVVKSANLIYGGISPDFSHATNTEKYLVGKKLFDTNTLKGAIQQLSSEINPDFVPPDAQAEFRKNLSLALFYKMILNHAPRDKLSPKNQSGGNRLERPLSSGVQDYKTNKKLYPVNKPIPKLEALVQCSGEAKYINDMPKFPKEVFGAFVLAEAKPLSIIKNIDTSTALEMPGVVAFFGSKDVRGKNNYSPPNICPTEEELFCSGKVLFNGQPVGVIIAETHEKAVEAAKYVHITYEKTSDIPAFNIQDVLKNKQTSKIKKNVYIKPKKKGSDTKHKITGTFDIGGQYHYTMETLCAICVPTEDGFDVYAATQFLGHVQACISQSLNVPMNKINVYVKRLGGGYGAKIMRTSLISTACAVAAQILNKPVRISMPLIDNMKAIGKRMPTYATYSLECNDKGAIQNMTNTYYKDYGTSGDNENVTTHLVGFFLNAYNVDTWEIIGNDVQTDMPGHCSCRAPGSSEGVAMIESIMDHIAMELNLDPLEVRLTNLATERKEMNNLINDLREWSNYDKRKQAIEEFNSKNRWIKKGLSFVIMNYPFSMWGQFSVLLSIFAGDGTVTVSHGGVECGQGINTKVAQVCAYTLQIPLEKVNVYTTNTFTSPNNSQTGGSLTSEACSFAVMQACKEILKRLEPFKNQMKDATWEKVVAEASKNDVELSTTYMFTANAGLKPYDILGACVTEVEVDVLTGEHTIPHVDMIEDTGTSLSPEVDIGQIEGAFVMGLGYWTCEDLTYDKDGNLLTNTTWTYKIPGVKEIPNNFRIQLKKDGNNPAGLLNSKATGEPPLCLSVSVPLAIRHAMASARKDSDSKPSKWIPIDGPTTVDFKFQKCLSNPNSFTL